MPVMRCVENAAMKMLIGEVFAMLRFAGLVPCWLMNVMLLGLVVCLMPCLCLNAAVRLILSADQKENVCAMMMKKMMKKPFV